MSATGLPLADCRWFLVGVPPFASHLATTGGPLLVLSRRADADEPLLSHHLPPAVQRRLADWGLGRHSPHPVDLDLKVFVLGQLFCYFDGGVSFRGYLYVYEYTPLVLLVLDEDVRSVCFCCVFLILNNVFVGLNNKYWI